MLVFVLVVMVSVVVGVIAGSVSRRRQSPAQRGVIFFVARFLVEPHVKQHVAQLGTPVCRCGVCV